MENKKIRPMNWLSILRVIATLMIIMVHFGQSLPLPQMLKYPISFGQTAVCVFFILTGYFTSQSIEKVKNTARYYAGRIVRIIPVYYCVIIVNIIASVIIKYPNSDPMHLGWLRFFFFLNGILPSTNYIVWNNCAAFWTMSGFCIFYIAAPFLARMMKTPINRIIVLLCGVIVSLGTEHIFMLLANNGSAYAESFGYLATHSFFFVFYEMILGMYINLTDKTKGKAIIPIILIWLIGAIYKEQWYSYTAGYAFIIYIFSIFKDTGIKNGTVLFATISLLDEYSYSIYLGHTTVMFIFSRLQDRIGFSNVYLALFDLVGCAIFIPFLHNIVEMKVGTWLREKILAK